MANDHGDHRRTADIDIAVLATEFKNLTAIVAEIAARVQHLDDKVDRLAFVHPDVYIADRKAMMERISAVESFKEWFFRLIAGAIFVGLIGALLAVKS